MANVDDIHGISSWYQGHIGHPSIMAQRPYQDRFAFPEAINEYLLYMAAVGSFVHALTVNGVADRANLIMARTLVEAGLLSTFIKKE